jgi:hypothetical protein
LKIDACSYPVQFGKVVTSDSSSARTNERNPYYQAAYAAVDASLASRQQCKVREKKKDHYIFPSQPRADQREGCLLHSPYAIYI